MGMDDAVAADAVQALADLTEEMQRRGRTLGAHPGRPPKVSRTLADRAGLGLHPLVLAIDECHELFQHKAYSKQAQELAVRVIKRGRKYGITLLLATQSPTKDSIPKEVTRTISCGVAFAVADHIANDGLLGTGRYRAGIRATELRMKTDRGSCVAVGVTDQRWELVRTFYVPFEDGIDLVSPVVAHALALVAGQGRELTVTAEPDDEAPPVDHLADIAHVVGGERRVRTHTVLTRLAIHNPGEYEGWAFADLSTTLAAHGIQPVKSHGVMVIRADDITAARAAHTQSGQDGECGDSAGEASGRRGVLPGTSPGQTPRVDQLKPRLGRHTGTSREGAETPGNEGPAPPAPGFLPEGNATGGRDDP